METNPWLQSFPGWLQQWPRVQWKIDLSNKEDDLFDELTKRPLITHLLITFPLKKDAKKDRYNQHYPKLEKLLEEEFPAASFVAYEGFPHYSVPIDSVPIHRLPHAPDALLLALSLRASARGKIDLTFASVTVTDFGTQCALRSQHNRTLTFIGAASELDVHRSTMIVSSAVEKVTFLPGPHRASSHAGLLACVLRNIHTPLSVCFQERGSSLADQYVLTQKQWDFIFCGTHDWTSTRSRTASFGWENLASLELRMVSLVDGTNICSSFFNDIASSKLQELALTGVVLESHSLGCFLNLLKDDSSHISSLRLSSIETTMTDEQKVALAKSIRAASWKSLKWLSCQNISCFLARALGRVLHQMELEVVHLSILPPITKHHSPRQTLMHFLPLNHFIGTFTCPVRQRIAEQKGLYGFYATTVLEEGDERQGIFTSDDQQEWRNLAYWNQKYINGSASWKIGDRNLLRGEAAPLSQQSPTPSTASTAPFSPEPDSCSDAEMVRRIHERGGAAF